MKEDFTPTGADPHRLHLGAGRRLPRQRHDACSSSRSRRGCSARTSTSGLLYFFAIGGLSVVGLLMAGWSSYNKYSLLGGLRAAAQVVSYEIPLTLSVVGLILLAGTMSLNRSSLNQSRLVHRLVHLPAAARRPDLLHRRDRRGEPHAVRPDRGRLRDRRRLRHRVLGHALRVLLLRRVRERVHRLGADRDPVLRRLERAVPVAVADRRCRSTRVARASACCSSSRIVPARPDPRSSPPRSGSPARASRAGRRCSSASCSPTCSSSRCIGAWAYIGLDWVAGILWFMGKTYALRVHVRVDARHAAAGPHRPADGLRLEVAAAGVAAQPVRDRGARSSSSRR